MLKIKLLIIIIHLIFTNEILAFKIVDAQSEFFDLVPDKSVVYKVILSKHPQIVIIKNHEIDTYTEISIDGNKKYYASWMGLNGFYYIFIPSGTHYLELKINALDSSNQQSIIEIKHASLINISKGIIDAFKDHSNATEMRYQHYNGGADKRLETIKLFSHSKSIFIQNNFSFFAALSSYETAITLNELSRNTESIKELDIAIKYWNKPEFIYQKLQATNVKGLVLWQQQKLDRALFVFKELLKEFKILNNTTFIAQTLSNIGLIYWDMNEIIKAQFSYIEALLIQDITFKTNQEYLNSEPFRVRLTNNNLKSVAATINNLALTYDALGNPNIAENLWVIYLGLSQSLSDKNTLAQAENNISLIYLYKANYKKAKNLLEQAIKTFKKTNNKRWLSLSQHNLGQVYLKLGLFNLAEIQFNKAIGIRDEINNPKGLIESRLKLMEIYRKQGQYKKSIAMSANTIGLAKKINHHKSIASIHLNNYHISKVNNNLTKAEQHINKAIKVAKGKTYKRLFSKLLVNKAELLLLQNNSLAAIEILKEQTEELKNIWDTKLLNTANNLLAKAYIQNKDYELAEKTINNEIDNLNFYINSSNSNKIRSDLTRMLKQTLSIYALISVRLNKPEGGFVKINQMLARHQKINHNGADSESNISSESIHNLLDKIKYKSIALENNNLSADDRKEIQNNIIELKAKLDFSYTAQDNNKELQISFKAIQDKLDGETLVIQFTIGDAGGTSWWISKDRVESHVLANKQDISKLIESARGFFMQKNKSFVSIKDLSTELLAPLKHFKNIKRILLILDEPLNLVPFYALNDPRYAHNQGLIDTTVIKRLVTVSSIFNYGSEQISKNDGALIIADPVTSTNDLRLKDITIKTENTQSFDRLLGTQFEANNLGKLLNAEVLQGFEANINNFHASGFNNKKILHFATHAFFHPEISGLSSLVLSSYNKDGSNHKSTFLRALEISNMDLNNDLVVLSGCETGVGIYDDSLGLNGLTHSFIQAGAQNLIASLWKVNDRVTERMMTEFYRGYTNGLGINEALWQAQKLIRNNPRTRHPKYWAGWFLLSR